MTKHRPPLSIEAALGRISGQLPNGIDDMAKETKRQPGLIRAWSDPERREKIPVDDAIALDLAYMSAGGEGAPLYEAYGSKLKLAGIERFASRIQLGRLAAEAIKESGEAHSAMVLAALPDADSHDIVVARKEVEQALAVLGRALPLLQGFGPPQSTGPPET